MIRRLLFVALLCFFLAVYLASSGSPILRPAYRYDTRHDILPDRLWDRGLPFRDNYREEPELVPGAAATSSYGTDSLQAAVAADR